MRAAEHDGIHSGAKQFLKIAGDDTFGNFVIQPAFLDERDEKRARFGDASIARSYALEKIVARVPMTPTFPLRVALTAASAPGRMTPMTGTRSVSSND
jgi:hypothetical protein